MRVSLVKNLISIILIDFRYIEIAGVLCDACYFFALKGMIASDMLLQREAGLVKAMVLLANNPKHPSLQSHEIEVLTSRYRTKVWCSYLQNNTPAAGRIFWSYGPDKGDITILAIEPHPNDSKSNAYKKITLSLMQTKKE